MLSMSKTGKSITFTLGKYKKTRRFRTIEDAKRFLLAFGDWMESKNEGLGIFSFYVFGREKF